jgi:hypothetical protein
MLFVDGTTGHQLLELLTTERAEVARMLGLLAKPRSCLDEDQRLDDRQPSPMPG